MNFSLEIGPKTDIETVPAVSDVYITMLPGGDYKETAEKAVELELDIIGTEKPTTIGAMKKRLQRAEELGVTKNTGNSKWKYIYPGTIGT